jgi:hypothetical protein
MALDNLFHPVLRKLSPNLKTGPRVLNLAYQVLYDMIVPALSLLLFFLPVELDADIVTNLSIFSPLKTGVYWRMDCV